ncbi:hypothetical protein PUN28_003374 [Cardiocondyla obscurior]|uniref:Uncharacterized protein n=1 Tax=Cardiocondyla obscurior TaxID=286306 RepID=A0AAW2GLH9_9HYME
MHDTVRNVPKLLYRRSIYGDEKHSLPSTPVAPAKGSTAAEKRRARVLPPLRRSRPVGDRQEGGRNPLHFNSTGRYCRDTRKG